MTRRSGPRNFSRSDRVGPLVHEIVAEQLLYIDDDRLIQVSITGVEVDNELAKAKVFFDTYDGSDESIADALDAFAKYRGKLRYAVGQRTRVRRVPELDFRCDPAISAGNRVEEILRSIEPSSVDQSDSAVETDIERE